MKPCRRGVMLALFVALASLLAACERTYYRVRMKPTAEGLERETTCWVGARKEQSLPARRLVDIETSYGAPPRAVGNQHVFVNTFRRALPGDLRGAGSYFASTTALGSSYTYMERVGGPADPSKGLRQRLKAGDRVVNLLRTWMRVELGRHARHAHLDRFIDGPLRKDVATLVHMIWHAGHFPFAIENKEGPRKAGAATLQARIQQFLIERKYVAVSDAPDTPGPDAWDDAKILPAMIARPLGLKPGPEQARVLAFLQDNKSLHRFLRGTDMYREYLVFYEKMQAAKPPLGPGQTESTMFDFKSEEWALMFLVCEAMGMKPTPTSETMDWQIEIVCPDKPLRTNGTWDEASKVLRWSGQTLVPSLSMPPLCHARWTVADEAEQIRRFGRVVLRGEALAEHAAWVRALSADERSAWNATLAACTPQTVPQWLERRDVALAYPDGRGLKAVLTSDPPADELPAHAPPK